MFLVFVVVLYLNVTSPNVKKSLEKVVENFSGKALSKFRGNSNKIKVYPDHNDKTYTRLFDIVTDEPALYKNDILQIKELTNLNEKSRVLDAGCGTGKHFKIIKELIPKIEMEGVDRSKNMIIRTQYYVYMKH
jgi:SAM-dependent methyltransferase